MNAKRGLHRRIEALEKRLSQSQQERSTDIRERMKVHLDRVVRRRRGELSEEEAAEVEATNAAIERRMREIRGEGGR